MDETQSIESIKLCWKEYYREWKKCDDWRWKPIIRVQMWGCVRLIVENLRIIKGIDKE